MVPETYGWAVALDHVRPFIFLIETPVSRGTGFLLSLDAGQGLVGIATAWHVVQQAIDNEDDLRLTHCVSGRRALLSKDHRHVAVNKQADLAMLSVHPGDVPLPTAELPRVGDDQSLREGAALGWCGFPSVAPGRLCFFKGCVSAIMAEQYSYLVDGVLINGVSGGPAFALEDDGSARLIGLLSAYIPNVSTGTALPGLGVVRAINSYGELFSLLREAEHESSQQSLPVAEYVQTDF